MSNIALRTAIASLMVASISALADTTPSVVLDPVVVTVSRSVQPTSQTPAAVSVINEQEINKNPSLNLSDVLQKDANIYVKQNGGVGQGTGVSLRGAYPKHTLMLKDGVKLNTPNTLTPTYPETLDLTDAERIEIVKGPASVQYGSDAIAGVVNVISRTPTKTGGFITGMYGENDSYKAIIGADLVAENGLYATVRGQRLETDGTRIFNTQSRDEQAGYDQKGYSAKVGYNNRQNLDASVAISHNEGTNVYSDDGGATNTAERQFENRTIIAKITGKVRDDITLSAHYGNAKDEQTYVESYSTNEYNTERQEFDVNGRWQFTPTQNILIGATTGKDEYQDAYAYQGTKDIKSTGYYAQHQYNSDKLNTQIGVRLEDHDTFGTHTVGQAAARYHFTPRTSVFANIGSAFKAPSLNELYYNSTSTWYGTTYKTLGNSELKPEESVSYELGFDHDVNDNLHLSLSGYHTDIKNLITTTSTFANNVSTSTYQNVDKAKFTGGELGIKYTQGDYYAAANYNYVKTENKATGLEIAYRPKHTGTLTLGYDNGEVGTSVSLIAHDHSNASNSANAIKAPGYATVDVDAYWNINPHIKLFTNIKNIGNIESPIVYNYGNWYVNGGRQANIGLTLSY